MDTALDTPTETATAALRQALGEAVADADTAVGSSLCVLVDPTLHDPLAEHADTRALLRLPLHIDAFAPGQRPYLLVIHDSLAQERALNTTVRVAVEECLGLHDDDREAGQPRSVCAWITADTLRDPQQQRALAYGLALQASVLPPPPYAGQRKTFRYWDPRLSVHLPRCLGEAVWRQTLAGLRIRGWWNLQAGGVLAPVGAVVAPDPGDRPPTAQAWTLDTRQWQALLAIGWGQRVAQLLPDWELPQMPEPSAIDDAVRRALAHGLHEEADVLGFAQCALTYHPQFDRHPEVARSIETLPRAGGVAHGFAALTQRWPETLLDQLHQAPAT